ncbi:uncharacterized protein LOC143354623 [Halictus rubicundus]|uniref:uncharacterized protein LOC143354623 n=1 Tax=Halictus rubicundus TaxID=77578 RepID=UPI004036C3F5
MIQNTASGKHRSPKLPANFTVGTRKKNTIFRPRATAPATFYMLEDRKKFSRHHVPDYGPKRMTLSQQAVSNFAVHGNHFLTGLFFVYLPGLPSFSSCRHDYSTRCPRTLPNRVAVSILP